MPPFGSTKGRRLLTHCSRCITRLVLDALGVRPERVTTDPLELPPEATGAALVASAGSTSTLNLEGSNDGGVTWERLASRSSMTGQHVATCEHEPANGAAPGAPHASPRDGEHVGQRGREDGLGGLKAVTFNRDALRLRFGGSGPRL